MGGIGPHVEDKPMNPEEEPLLDGEGREGSTAIDALC